MAPMQIGRWGQLRNGCTIGTIPTIIIVMYRIYTACFKQSDIALSYAGTVLGSQNLINCPGRRIHRLVHGLESLSVGPTT